jgi:SAM-dependent methyltransferase
MTTALSEVLGEERRIMNLYAPHYDAAVLSNSYVYRIERAEFVAWMTETLRDAGRDPRTLSVLDAGCATGGVMDLLSQAGFTRLTGIDLSEEMLVEARRRGIPGASWVQATIEEAPFARATFDVIVASFTLHHLRDLRAFFGLADWALRPGGWFFALEYDDSSPLADARHGSRRALGDVVRRAFARKNRRHLARLPVLPALFNPAHRQLAFADIDRAIGDPGSYEIRRSTRGVLLPALLPVLVEESAFDRMVARVASAADRRLERRVGGLFQWIAGRRVETARGRH